MRPLMLTASIFLLACGGNGGAEEDTSTDSPGDTLDTQGDTSPDTTSDTVEDTPVDTAVDTSPDTAEDTLPDTAVDTSTDTSPDEAVEVEAPECTLDGDCDNGAFCDGEETCSVEGTCQEGTLVACDDTDPCTTDRCNEDDDECTFDPTDGDGDGYAAAMGPGGEMCPGTDCDDTRDFVHPGAPNICTATMDADCDGIVDGVPVKITPDLQLSSAPDASSPDVAWNGSSYGIAWREPFTLGACVFAGATGDGSVLISPSTARTCGAFSGRLSLTWTGSEYGLFGTSNNQFLEFSGITAAGVGTGIWQSWFTGTLIVNPGLAWMGSAFGLTWNSATGPALHFGLANESGAMIVPDAGISSPGGSSPAISWAGSEFGVAWVDARDGHGEIFFTRVAPTGAEIGDDTRITANDGFDSSSPSIAWTGSEYGVAWQDSRHGANFEIYFSRISVDGTAIGTEARITTHGLGALGPDLAWMQAAYALAWADLRNGTSWNVNLMLIAGDGSAIGSDLPVTAGSPIVEYPSLAWSGSEMGLAWNGSGIWFTVISPCD